MPHPQANHKAVATLAEAFEYLRGIQQNRRLWTILKFDAHDRYHVFHSTSTFTQQMFNISSTILSQSGHYGRGVVGGRELARDMTNALAMGQIGQPHAWGGHAEEHMIQHFDRCLDPSAGTPRTVVIWNSDTPCRVHDRQPSDNLAGWPPSCSAKLDTLAQQRVAFRFMVHIRKTFGALQGQSLANAVAVLNSEKQAPNLSYHAFSDELAHMSRGL